ncbi:aldo/keto reductase [Nocardia neocaledoniensis]|uniref:aldo/keto reductase n=2 Tax=Nocardia neocaledoniensis TaxID=236511 RepID=UPI0035A22628
MFSRGLGITAVSAETFSARWWASRTATGQLPAELRRMDTRAGHRGRGAVIVITSCADGIPARIPVPALHPRPDDMTIATRVWIVRCRPTGWGSDGGPESLCDQVDLALRRRRTERIGPTQSHRINPKVPVPDQVGALGKLELDTKVGHIGPSEVAAGQLVGCRCTASPGSLAWLLARAPGRRADPRCLRRPSPHRAPWWLLTAAMDLDPRPSHEFRGVP